LGALLLRRGEGRGGEGRRGEGRRGEGKGHEPPTLFGGSLRLCNNKYVARQT